MGSVSGSIGALALATGACLAIDAVNSPCPTSSNGVIIVLRTASVPLAHDDMSEQDARGPEEHDDRAPAG